MAVYSMADRNRTPLAGALACPATDYAMACRLAAMAGSSILSAGGADKAPDRGASRQVLYAALVSPTRVQNGGDGDESGAPPHLNLNVTVFGAANGDAPRRRWRLGSRGCRRRPAVSRAGAETLASRRRCRRCRCCRRRPPSPPPPPLRRWRRRRTWRPLPMPAAPVHGRRLLNHLTRTTNRRHPPQAPAGRTRVHGRRRVPRRRTDPPEDQSRSRSPPKPSC